ncbi:MAG: hypothetical protein ABFS16_14750 [Bacteroidota bacterium]
MDKKVILTFLILYGLFNNFCTFSGQERDVINFSLGWQFMRVADSITELPDLNNPVWSDVDGISFLPKLLIQPQKEHEYLVWEYFSYNYTWKPGSEGSRNQLGSQAVRKGEWKGVRKGLKKTPEAPVELYDLSKDIGEQNNLQRNIRIL